VLRINNTTKNTFKTESELKLRNASLANSRRAGVGRQTHTQGQIKSLKFQSFTHLIYHIAKHTTAFGQRPAFSVDHAVKGRDAHTRLVVRKRLARPTAGALNQPYRVRLWVTATAHQYAPLSVRDRPCVM
jgi:hypothetical protein